MFFVLLSLFFFLKMSLCERVTRAGHTCHSWPRSCTQVFHMGGRGTDTWTSRAALLPGWWQEAGLEAGQAGHTPAPFGVLASQAAAFLSDHCTCPGKVFLRNWLLFSPLQSAARCASGKLVGALSKPKHTGFKGDAGLDRALGVGAAGHPVSRLMQRWSLRESTAGRAGLLSTGGKSHGLRAAQLLLCE